MGWAGAPGGLPRRAGSTGRQPGFQALPLRSGARRQRDVRAAGRPPQYVRHSTLTSRQTRSSLQQESAKDVQVNEISSKKFSSKGGQGARPAVGGGVMLGGTRTGWRGSTSGLQPSRAGPRPPCDGMTRFPFPSQGGMAPKKAAAVLSWGGRAGGPAGVAVRGP